MALSSSSSRVNRDCRRFFVSLIFLVTAKLFLGSLRLHSNDQQPSTIAQTENHILLETLQENRVKTLEIETDEGSIEKLRRKIAKEDEVIRLTTESIATASDQTSRTVSRSSRQAVSSLGEKLAAANVTLTTAELATAAATTVITIRRNASNTTSDLGPILDDTVRMLLPPHQAEAYIQQYPGSEFKIYIYDNLTNQYTWEYSADCMNARSDGSCDWAESFCGVSLEGGGGEYSKRRFNRNGDVVISKLMAEYFGSSRTFNASEASLFVVPFPSQAHLHCEGRNTQSYYDQLQTELIDKLAYLAPATKHKHLFLSSAVQPASNKWLRSEFPLVVSIGQVQKECVRDKDSHVRPNCGQIIMPYVNMNENYQPHVVRHNFKPLRERTYALVAKLNSKISGNGSDRKRFMESAAAHEATHGSLIANKSMIVGELGAHRKMGNEMEILEAYRDTIFCPCLRGDEPPQKRFFDVILSGCLPVVLEYDSIEESYPSWFAVNTAAVHNVYPFAKGTFDGIDEMGIQYSDFVVTVNGTCGPPCIIPHLEGMLLHRMDELERMHETMQKFARFFSFGMANKALSTVDAMSAILVEARHYVANWKEVPSAETM
ncbi:hypothetical protein MPSEU_000087400 [Mayamaea pseudoterrestris]|nr:hypothetical protein MPSEU_000087400 [Mayamaea pseudoterrestris]